MNAYSVMENYISGIERCQSKADVFDQFKNIISRFDAKHITHFVTLPNKNSFSEPVGVSTYSQEWQEHYLGRNYSAIDPVIQKTLVQIMPLNWDSIDRSTQDNKIFFGEALEFGVGKRGISIPIRGTHGERAIFSINLDSRKNNWINDSVLNISTVQYMAYAYHGKICEIEGLFKNGPVPSLTPSELEVLKWATEGKTIWEIAKILGKGERVTSFHMHNAAQKLGCHSKAHAAVEAMRRGIVS